MRPTVSLSRFVVAMMAVAVFGISIGLSVGANPAHLAIPAIMSAGTAIIPPASAAYAQSITSSNTVIFKSIRAGGTQINGCTAFTITNEGAVDLLVNVRGHHLSDANDDPSEYGKIAAGTSATFTVRNVSANSTLQIDRVTVKSLTGTATISYMVTERF